MFSRWKQNTDLWDDGVHKKEWLLWNICGVIRDDKGMAKAIPS